MTEHRYDLDTVNGRPLWYGLDDKPITIEEADKLLVSPLRQVGSTHIGVYHISTVFLVIDHSLGILEGGKPVLYETMIFSQIENDDLDCEQWRYTSRPLAEYGHAMVVHYLRSHLLTRPALLPGSAVRAT